MNDIRQDAMHAAVRLQEEGGDPAVQEAAHEALSGEERHNEFYQLPSYPIAVSAFWKVRARFGIPALRDVLWSLNIPTEGM